MISEKLRCLLRRLIKIHCRRQYHNLSLITPHFLPCHPERPTGVEGSWHRSPAQHLDSAPRVVGNGFRPSVKALSWERVARRAGCGKVPTAPSSSPVIASRCGHRPLHPFTIDPVGNGFRPSVKALSWERVARRAGCGKVPTAPSSSPVIASRCAHWRGNPFPRPHSVTLHKFPPRISMRLIFA